MIDLFLLLTSTLFLSFSTLVAILSPLELSIWFGGRNRTITLIPSFVAGVCNPRSFPCGVCGGNSDPCECTSPDDCGDGVCGDADCGDIDGECGEGAVVG